MVDDCRIYDVCVIGAGINGSSAAFHAVQHTNNVLLCDQFPMRHSRGSSHGHSRIIRKAYFQQHYARMMPKAYEIWQNLEAATKTKLLIKTGLLSVERAPNETVKELEKNLQGINADHEYLTRESLANRFPMMHYPEDYNGIFDPSGGILRADKCCAAFQKLFQQAGGTIQECCKVTKIIPGEIITVQTIGSTIKAKSVIIAAGSWTNDLLGPLHLQLPLQRMKIDVCYWKADDTVYSVRNGFPCFSDPFLGTYIYAIPSFEYPGMMKICYHFGNDCHPDSRDSREDKTGISMVRKYIKDYLEGVDDEPSIIERCFYTFTPDEDFIIDTHPFHKNIIIGAGFSGHGFKLAPVTGKLLSQLALKIKPDYDLSPFSASRFRKKSSL